MDLFIIDCFKAGRLGFCSYFECFENNNSIENQWIIPTFHRIPTQLINRKYGGKTAPVGFLAQTFIHFMLILRITIKTVFFRAIDAIVVVVFVIFVITFNVHN